MKKKIIILRGRAVFKIKQRTVDVTDGGKYIHVAITLSTSQRLSKSQYQNCTSNNKIFQG